MKRKNIIGSRMNFQYQLLSQHGRQGLKNVNLTIYISATTGQICCDWAWWWDCFANFCSYKVTINIQSFIRWPSLYLRSAQGSKWQYKILNKLWLHPLLRMSSTALSPSFQDLWSIRCVQHTFACKHTMWNFSGQGW